VFAVSIERAHFLKNKLLSEVDQRNALSDEI